MRNSNLVLISILSLVATACGQAKLTLPNGATFTVTSGSPESSAFADVQSCPANMTYIAAGVGYGAFCIDSTPMTANIHGTNTTNCLLVNKVMCSTTELAMACQAGKTGAGHYWSSETTGESGPAVNAGEFNGVGCTSMGTLTISIGAPTNAAYCCSR